VVSPVSHAGNKYAKTNMPDGSHLYLHRLIPGLTDPKTKVDHRDGDGLNCRRRNLRIASDAANNMNRRSKRDIYKGVFSTAENGKRSSATTESESTLACMKHRKRRPLPTIAKRLSCSAILRVSTRSVTRAMKWRKQRYNGTDAPLPLSRLLHRF
jgi:hypothetical protein